MTPKHSPRPLRVARLGGFTIVGLAIAALGWVLLLGSLLVSDATLQAGSLVARLSIRADLVTLSQTAVASGFGLAIIGALRSGFGAFGQFFDAVLQRSARPRTSAPPEPTVPPISVAPVDREPPIPRARASDRDRNYVILPDGSVEVETMFGTRVFATLDEAREFIR
jgi:hypothetical protein